MFHCPTIAAKLPCPSLLLCSFDTRDTSPISANYQVLNRHEAEQAGAGQQEHADGLLPDSESWNLFHVCKTRWSAASPCRTQRPRVTRRGVIRDSMKSHMSPRSLSPALCSTCAWIELRPFSGWSERMAFFTCPLALALNAWLSLAEGVKWESVNCVQGQNLSWMKLSKYS